MNREKSLLIALKRFAGLSIILMVPLCVCFSLLGSNWNNDCGSWFQSVDYLYWTSGRDIFVGLIFMAAVFFILYEGYSWMEKTANILTGCCLLGLLFFPSYSKAVLLNNFPDSFELLPWIGKNAGNIIHEICAMGVLVIQIFNLSFNFTKQNGEIAEKKMQRKIAYYICGGAGAVLFAVILAVNVLAGAGKAGKNCFGMIVQELAILDICAAWLVRGEGLEYLKSDDRFKRDLQNPEYKFLIKYKRVVHFCIMLVIPVALLAGILGRHWINEKGIWYQSFSCTYWTSGRNVFAGFLFTGSLYFFIYKGYGWIERIINIFTGIFLMGLVFFPTYSESVVFNNFPKSFELLPYLDNAICNNGHTISAVGLFITQTFNMIYTAVKQNGEKADKKNQRKIIYCVCSVIAILLLIINQTLLTLDGAGVISTSESFCILTVQLLAILDIGFALLIKNEGIGE